MNGLTSQRDSVLLIKLLTIGGEKLEDNEKLKQGQNSPGHIHPIQEENRLISIKEVGYHTNNQ